MFGNKNYPWRCWLVVHSRTTAQRRFARQKTLLLHKTTAILDGINALSIFRNNVLSEGKSCKIKVYADVHFWCSDNTDIRIFLKMQGGYYTSLHHFVKTSFLYFFIKYIKYFISKYFYSHRHGFNTEIRMNMIYITTTLYFLQILFSVNERATAPYGDIQTGLMRLPSSRLFLTFDVFSDFP